MMKRWIYASGILLGILLLAPSGKAQSQLLTGCTVSSTNTVQSCTNSFPPSGWALIDAQGFDAGGLNSGESFVNGGTNVTSTNCTVAKTGSCSMDGFIKGSFAGGYGLKLAGTNINKREIWVAFDAMDQNSNPMSNSAGDHVYTNDFRLIRTPAGQGPGFGIQFDQNRNNSWILGNGPFAAIYGSLSGHGWSSFGSFFAENPGTWRHYEFHIKANDPGQTNGVVEYFVDGTRVAVCSAATNCPTQVTAGNLVGNLDFATADLLVGGDWGANFWKDNSNVCSTNGDLGTPNFGTMNDAACQCSNQCPPSGVIPNWHRYIDNLIVLGASSSPSPPAVSVNPTSLSYGNQNLDTTSAAQSMTLTNTGGSSLSITSIATTGTNPSDFSISSNTCGASLSAGSSCVVSVTFTPSVVGSRSANLTFTTNAASSPNSFALSGTGTQTDIYLAQAAAGIADGSTCANPRAASFFNSSANWGTTPGQIGSGITVHICGTISTSLANPTSQGTGTITIKLETNASLAQTAATNILSLTNSSNSFLVTGQASCGWINRAFVACTEKIQNTANGSRGHFANTVTGVKVIDVSGTTGAVTIQNLEIGPGYVHNDLNDSSFLDGAHLANCVWADQLMGSVTIQSSYLHDCSFNVSLNPRQSSPNPVVTIANVEFFHNDHDFVMQSTCNPSCYSVVLHDNHSHDHTNWNTLTNQYHHDGFHFFNLQTQASSVLMYNNLFDGPWTANSTGPIFNQVAVQNLTAFNNIFICTVANCIDTPLAMWQYGGGPNQLLVNNTFVQTGASRTGIVNYVQVTAGGTGYTSAPTVSFSYGNATATAVVSGGAVTAVNMTNQGTGYNPIPTVFLSGGGGTGASASASVAFNNNGGVLMNPGGAGTSSNTTFMNNIVDGASTMIDLEGQVLAANSATSGLDYNLYSNYQTSGSKAFVWNGTRTDTFGPGAGTWQGLSGEGIHSSLVASANLDSTGKPQASSPAIGTGTNLTARCVGNLTALCTDYAGVARPATGPWTIGAFQVTATNPVVVLTPASLTYASQLTAVASPSQSVTLTNNGPGSVLVSGVSITGTNSGDFSQSNTCGTVTQGNSCTITVTFTPTAVGSRTASITITDNGTGNPQSVPLSGTAVVPTLSVSSIAFGNALVNSANPPTQIVVLSNPSAGPLTIVGVTVTGDTTDFSQVNTCGTSLAAGLACNITAKFAPSTLFPVSATLNVAHNAGNSPQTVSLTGTGIGQIIGVGTISGSGVIVLQP